MRPSLRLPALGGWPRRLAALACLLLAAITALQPPPAASTAAVRPGSRPVVDGLHNGEVAVPVELATSAACTLLRPGDRVDLYPASPDDSAAAPRAAPAGAGLRVLALLHCSSSPRPESQGDGAAVVVSAGSGDAARLAGFLPRPMVAVLRGPG